MNGQKEIILITGCSGRIGFKAAERFAGVYPLVGFDVFMAGHLPSIEFLMVDLASNESVHEGLMQVRKKFGSKIASVIHLAAYYNFSGGNSADYDRITVQGTQRLLKGLQSFEVQQFIFSSTMLVHAPCKPKERIDENWPLQPKWAYPQSKVTTEELIRRERGNISTVILRIAGVYDDHCHSIPLSNQIQRIYENQLESHVFPGNLSHGACYLHLDDLIEVFWLLVQKRKEIPKDLILLVGEPETLSYADLQKEMGRLIHGKEWKTWRIPKIVAKLGAFCQDHLPFFKNSFIKPWMIDLADDHYALDISKARTVLGWQPRRSLRKALPKMIKELKADPIAWYDENKLKPPRWLLKKKAHS